MEQSLTVSNIKYEVANWKLSPINSGQLVINGVFADSLKVRAKQEVDSREVLSVVEDLILDLKSKRDKLPLDKEGYKNIVSVYNDTIKALIYCEDELYKSSLK